MDSGQPNGLKWLLLGCGGIILLAIVGGAAFAVFASRSIRAIQEESGAISDVGAAYLRSEPKILQELGPISSVEHRALPYRVFYARDKGTAFFTYGLKGEKGSGEAQVWLERPTGSPWAVTGAVVTTADQRLIKVGSVPEPPKINRKVD
jgi:hypothetical protein